jgi:phosphoenolpyruvate carboxykinase (ATP)
MESVSRKGATLEAHGIVSSGTIHWNLETPTLVKISVERNEGILSAHGALVTETGDRTGR